MSYRFIPFAEFNGALNMAIDEYLLEQQMLGAPPVLRLYAFNPPTVTLGHSQKIEADAISRIQSRGFEVARRPTGGRAVLHYKDLTYSFAARELNESDSGILAKSVSAAYKQICSGLQNAFEILGLKAELGSSEVPYRHLADCFLATTNADLQVAGKKLAGSAQLRRRGAVLQHGSIPLNLEQGLMLELLEGKSLADCPELAGTNRHANLFEALNREVPHAELCQAIQEGFERAFAHSFDEQALSEQELAAASKFLQKEALVS
jgi:lipoate-protein ligase A